MPLETDASKVVPETQPLPTPGEIEHKEKVTLVKPQASEVFTERHHFLQDPFEYERKGSDPGLVLIFNQETFPKNYRLGSRRDVNEIIVCMSRLGFNIEPERIFTDFTRDKILGTVEKIVSQDLSEVNSLIVFFLTHGSNFNELYATDFSLRTDELWDKFADCKQLKNKPKLFIFQACKGEGASCEKTSDVQLVPEKTFRTNYIGPDMLIVYATAEGNVSFRDTQRGTWFIQELCKNFLAYGRRDDVVSLVIRMTKCLCRNYYYHDKDIIKKQMPIFISTLTRRFYLSRNKERNVWMKLLQDQESMKERIGDLEKIVEGLLQQKEKRNK